MGVVPHIYPTCVVLTYLLSFLVNKAPPPHPPPPHIRLSHARALSFSLALSEKTRLEGTGRFDGLGVVAGAQAGV